MTRWLELLASTSTTLFGSSRVFRALALKVLLPALRRLRWHLACQSAREHRKRFLRAQMDPEVWGPWVPVPVSRLEHLVSRAVRFLQCEKNGIVFDVYLKNKESNGN